MNIVALLLALASVAAAEPRAGVQTFEVDAGPAVFDLHETNGGVDPAMTFRIAIGRYWNDRFALGLLFVDHAFVHEFGNTHELENALTLAVAAQYWFRPTVFGELAVGATDARSASTFPDLLFGGWSAAARGGIVLDDGLVLSAELFHTWVGSEGASTDACSVLVGWAM